MNGLFCDSEAAERLTGIRAELLAENKRLRKVLEDLGVALRTDSRQKTITGDAVEYHLDGSRMYHAINAVRAALKGDQP